MIYIANDLRWKDFVDGQDITKLQEKFCGLFTPVIFKEMHSHVSPYFI